MRDVSARDIEVQLLLIFLKINFFVYSFDYWHKKQSGGRGEYARVIGTVEVGGGWISDKHIHVFI